MEAIMTGSYSPLSSSPPRLPLPPPPATPFLPLNSLRLFHDTPSIHLSPLSLVAWFSFTGVYTYKFIPQVNWHSRVSSERRMETNTVHISVCY